jgi:hypothetical protein
MIMRAVLATRQFVIAFAATSLACTTRKPDAVADTTPAAPPSSTAASRVDSAKPTDSAASPLTAAADSIKPLLETGCSGGITGGGSGTFVTATGHFYRYERGGPAPNAKREMTLLRQDSAAAAALVQTAEREGITRIKYSEPSNMTCYLSLDRGGASFEVAWPIGTSPRPIRKLVDLAKRIQ